MANWCNAQLIVAGQRRDVLRFSRIARAQPSSLFKPDMLHGEAQDLFAERMEKLQPDLAKKAYIFQIRNDDGLEHFRLVSRDFPALCFVLVYFDPNNDPSGSYFISRGRARKYFVPVELHEAVMARHGITEDSYDKWDSDDERHYWEASWELMELAEAHWQDTVLKALRG